MVDSSRGVDTSLRASRITLRLYFVVDYERRKFCQDNDLLPPPNLHGQRLLAWIDRRRRRDGRCKVKRKMPWGQLELPLSA